MKFAYIFLLLSIPLFINAMDDDQLQKDFIHQLFGPSASIQKVGKNTFLINNEYAMINPPGNSYYNPAVSSSSFRYPMPPRSPLIIEEKYKYNNEVLYKDSSLHQNLPISSYWQSLQDKDQSEKDEALKEVLKKITGDPHYLLLRRNVFDAIRIGAKPNDESNDELSLETILKNDTSLLELMIKKGLLTNNYKKSFFPSSTTQKQKQ